MGPESVRGASGGPGGGIGGAIYKANIDFLPDLCIGDYVIVHAGFAIEKLDEAVALENLAAWQEVAADAQVKPGR